MRGPRPTLLGAAHRHAGVVFDPKVPGVACHVSQARTGGLGGTIGLAEDPSRFSIACRQVGPITVDVSALTDQEEVYSARTSIFFKRTHVYRVLDKKRNTLVYLAISDKLDANHHELLSALDRQVTRINHLEADLARVDERTKI